MSPQDTILVKQARSGDAVAFGHLAERYRPLAYREIRRYLQHSDEVEDLVQDVFCKAFQQIGGLRQVQLFPAWLRRTAANAAVSWGRTRQRHQRLQDDVIASQFRVQESPDSSYERQQNAERLMGYLDALPSNERRALLLYYNEDCSYDQVSQCMDVSSASVKLYLRKGRKRLQARWHRNRLLPS
ncbi:MAG: RNA polymerase sigma factor [Candidatus Latescibacterota bacterium]|jgi:RNA polymerase sigma factor (sigma-70 family)